MSPARHYIEGRALKLKPNIREHLSELEETEDFLLSRIQLNTGPTQTMFSAFWIDNREFLDAGCEIHIKIVTHGVSALVLLPWRGLGLQSLQRNCQTLPTADKLYFLHRLR